MKTKTQPVHRCPLCGGAIRRLEFDPFNRWQCGKAECWLHANPIPSEVAARLGEVGAGMDWAADNGFWFGFCSACGLAATIALILWILQ